MSPHGMDFISTAIWSLGTVTIMAGSLDIPWNCSKECLYNAESTSFLQVGITTGNAPTHAAHPKEAIQLQMAASTNPYKLQDKDGTMCDIMAPLWRQAATILGMNESDLALDDECSFIDRFYWSRHEKKGYSSNYIRSYKLGNFHLTYVPQWKCGNDNIRDNMRRLGVPEASLANVAAGTGTQDSAVDDWHNVDDWVPDGEIFSIVREPFSRFISGYNEIEYRIANDELCDESHTGMDLTCDEALQSGTEQFDDLEPLTDERSLEFIKDILRYSLSPMIQYEHVFSMLGNLNAFNTNFNRRISYVGRTEQFDAAWSRMQDVGDLHFAEFRDEMGSHGSSDYTAGDNMREVLDTNENATLALACAVLLPDQVCLEYDSRVDIEVDCTSAGFAANQAVWKSIVSDIQTYLCPDIRELQALDAQ